MNTNLPVDFVEDNFIGEKDAFPIERCEWCKDDVNPCMECSDRARGLEKQGYIILLEHGYYIPLGNGRDEEDNLRQD